MVMVIAQEPQPSISLGLPVGPLYSDEPTMETDAHVRQMLLLISCLDWLWQDRDDFFASGNLTVYFSPKQLKSRDFRGPDFFVVLGTQRRSRKSWVVWEEDGKYPNLIVEILSESTAQVDRTTKKQLYQDTFRTPEYFWIDPNTLEFEGFLLVGGTYEAIPVNDAGHRWSQQLELYLGVYEEQLRFFSPDGELVPTPAEAAQQAQQAAQQAQQAAQQAQQSAQQTQEQNDRLVQKLRELGIDPETI